MFGKDKGLLLSLPIYPIKDGDKDVDEHPKIRRSLLHNVATRTTILPCAKMVKWIVDNVNLDNKTIFNY